MKKLSDLSLGTFLSTVDELASVHALSSYEGLCPQLVLVWVTECDLGQRGATARVVNDVLTKHYHRLLTT